LATTTVDDDLYLTKQNGKEGDDLSTPRDPGIVSSVCTQDQCQIFRHRRNYRGGNLQRANRAWDFHYLYF